MRRVLILAMCLFSTAPYAKPLVVTSEVSISNDNWYPLPQRDMKAATVDTALSEFTRSGHIIIVNDEGGARRSAPVDGNLEFDISLIGQAEVVKLTMTLQLERTATYVSTVSLDIHGLDYQGIYNAFEYVGGEAAKRLDAKLDILRGQPTAAGGAAGHSNTEAVKLFNRAQDLKREEKYREARAMYERVISLNDPDEPRLMEMAKDELRFGLPIFEADNMMLDNTLQDPLVVAAKMKQVQHLYRQILADNTDNPQRMMEIHRRLDNMSISRKALSRAMDANSLANATQLRVMLREYFMDYGAWPERKALEEMLDDLAEEFEITGYRAGGRRMNLALRNSKYGTQLELSGDDGGVTVRVGE